MTTKDPAYKSWTMMWARCTNPRATSFERYGGNGIRVCRRWASFQAFLSDLGPRPIGTSLDRIDGSKGYMPENCRWASKEQQNGNRRPFVPRKKPTPPQKSPPKLGRRGRPPIKNPATARVEFRCTPQEKAGYRRKAGTNGVSKWLKGLADKS